MLFCYELLLKSNEIKYSILLSFDLWKNNILPYLFPFFVISDLLVSLNFIEIINRFLQKIMFKLFKINSSSSFVFFMSIISGIPSNAKYINTLIKNNKLDDYEAEKILLFSHFCNPLFILGFIASILNNKSIAIIILCTHYITNIIIALLFRNFHVNDTFYDYSQKNTNSFLKTISSSILNSINTLILILGIITFFTSITTIINANISNPLIKSIICGLFEITQGINQIGSLNLSLRLKASLIAFIISFGGISGHIQVMSILEDTHIRYKLYLSSRILHAFIASILTFLLIN